MATHSSILAWEIPWTEESGRIQSMGPQESDMTQQLNHHHHIQIYVCVCMCVCIYMCVCVCVCVYIYIWLTHFDIQQKLTLYCKATILQLKTNQKLCPQSSHTCDLSQVFIWKRLLKYCSTGKLKRQRMYRLTINVKLCERHRITTIDIYYSAWATITAYHRLGGLNKKEFLLSQSSVS